MINKLLHVYNADKRHINGTHSVSLFLCVICDIFPLRFFARTLHFIFYFSFFFSSCTPDIEIPTPRAGDANFTKVVAVGGNYLSGYQNGALYLKGQKLSIPALLATQFKLVGGSQFNQSLMPDDKGLGLNNNAFENHFVTASSLGYKTDCKNNTFLSPLYDTVSVSNATPYLTGVAGNGIQDFSVPFAMLPDYFDPAFGKSFYSGNKNPYYNRLAGNPGISTIYEDAKAQYLTFLIAWLGMEDIYNYASKGGTGNPIASSANFNTRLDDLLRGLTNNGDNTGVIANIPDLRSFPYYTHIKWNDLELTQVQADSLNYFYNVTSGMPQIKFNSGKNGFIIKDVTAIGGYRQLHAGEYITMDVPQDSIKCFNYGLLPDPINDYYVLDSSEVYMIDQAVNSYNAVIVQKAEQYNLAFVDMHYYFNMVIKGVRWNGVNLNAAFITGGFYSLDGYHPNQKGYSLIANEFIKAVNSKYNAVIPTVNCVECDGIIFP